MCMYVCDIIIHIFIIILCMYKKIIITLPRPAPLANWCYGHHPFLWHPFCCLISELGVQQGDLDLKYPCVSNKRGFCWSQFHA